MSFTPQKSIARYGTPIRCNVKHEVAAALLQESKRTARSVGHVAAMVLEYWFEDVYLPTQKAKGKS